MNLQRLKLCYKIYKARYKRIWEILEIEAEEAEEASRGTLVHEKCIKQLVPNVARNAKFLSSQLKESRFIAKNAIEKESLINASLIIEFTDFFYFFVMF